MANPFTPGSEEYDVWERMEATHPYNQPTVDPNEPAPEPTYLDFLASKFMTTDQLDDIPEADPLVPGVLFLDKLAWLYGMPKSLKSFLALDLAGCVAAGLPWQGFPAGDPHPAVYLVAEGASGIRKRVRAWEEHYGQPMTGVHFLPVAVQAISDRTWEPFITLTKQRKPGLVIVDTQARVTTGVEENSAKEIGVFIRRLDQLREATGACVLTIHHTGRNGEHLRGSIAMDGAADTAILVNRAEGTVTVKCVYQKDVEEFEPFLSRLRVVDDSIVLRADRSASVIGLTKIPSWVSTWWDHHGADPISPSLLDETKVVAKATFYGHVKSLVKAGVVIKIETSRYPTYRLTHRPGDESEAESESPTARHVGLSDSSMSTVRQTLSDSPGQRTNTLCDICGEPMDFMLVQAGHPSHPGC